MNSRDERTVVICGGGIVGMCCAWALARDGARVTVVERNGESRDHCALGSAGYVSPSHVVPLAAPGVAWRGIKWMADPSSPFYMRPRLDPDFLRWGWLFWRAGTKSQVGRSAPILRDLCVTSLEMFVELDEILGGTMDFERKGLLNLCRTHEMLQHESEDLGRLANSLGVEARTIDANEVRAMNPGIAFDVVGAVYFPGDAHLTPAKFASALQSLLREMGVKFLWDTSVFGWRVDGGRISAVHTTAGELTADEYVLAGGSWSPSMLKGLDLRLPIQAGKGYSLTMENPPRRIVHPMILTEARIALTPMGSTMRFGGTMELSGVNDIVRPERVRQIIQSVPRYLPDFRPEEFAGIRPWIGLRPVSPDGLPYIGRFPQARNLIAACGHAMLGLTMAPVTGRLVTEIIHGRKPCVALDLLRPERFG